MGSLIYEEYLTAFETALDEFEYNRKYETLKEYRSKSDDTLEVIIKFYHESKDGISRQTFHSKKGDKFYIHGPVGPGIDLHFMNSKGLNIIFSGGTGILPFMDLFAYLGRKLLSEERPHYAIFPDEEFRDSNDETQFIIYIYFKTVRDAIALEFLENLEKLHQKFNKGHLFKLHIIYTRSGGSKFSDDELVDLLKDYRFLSRKINKLFV
mmetsp:Transcript_29997/g.26568  ORF Transcript_29997/g.26568 Transcript_29997/m.26568 type:complete len:209 (-) Transcript_29997:135-761(-)